jgi:hypothetical protein
MGHFVAVKNYDLIGIKTQVIACFDTQCVIEATSLLLWSLVHKATLAP